MLFSANVVETAFPPIAEAMSWVASRPDNVELLNMCQAVPSYPPAPALQAEISFAALGKRNELSTFRFQRRR